jgi:methionine biosynthesis protein MetW
VPIPALQTVTVRAQDQGVSGLPLNPLNLRGFFILALPDHDETFNASLTALLHSGGTLLDLACGDGDFLRAALKAGAKSAEGVEISQSGVLACVQKGLSVHHGDITEGLTSFPDQSFDCVSLIRTLELFERPEPVLDEMLRVGKTALVTFTNFGHWNQRTRRWMTGILPGAEDGRLGGAPARLTLAHLRRYCGQTGIRIERIAPMPHAVLSDLFPGVFAEEIAAVLSRPLPARPPEPVQLPLTDKK